MTYSKMPLFVWASAPWRALLLVVFIGRHLYISSIYYISQILADQLSNKCWFGKQSKTVDLKVDCKGSMMGNYCTRELLPSEDFYDEDNKFDTYKEEITGLYPQSNYKPNISNIIENIVAQIFGLLHVGSSFNKKCMEKVLISAFIFICKRLRKSNQTKNLIIAQTWDLNAYSRGQRINSSLITKLSSHKFNSLRMHHTSTSAFTKVNKRSALVAILINELKEHKNKNEDVYTNLNKILGDKYFWIAAYETICKNPGNMTKGTNNETLDGINLEWFEKLTKDILSGKYQPQPVRTVEIPKANGKTRELKISNPRDKVVQAGLASIVEAIWEPLFLDSSHGFRPNRSTHTALKSLWLQGSRYKWVIQGDISKCFDMIPHSIIRDRLTDKIKCHNTMSLINKCLKTKIKMPNSTIAISKLGTPQGSVLSPILANIVLHAFDEFMEKYKIDFKIGKSRRQNPKYTALVRARAKALKEGDNKGVYNSIKLKRLVPKGDQFDPNFKRLMYVR